MRVLLSGGGTAGHINPAIAIADYVREKEPSEFLFIGTRRGMENRLVPKKGYEIKNIEIMGLKRSLSLENAKLFYMMVKAKSDAGKIIDEFKPDIVLATGGYVCVPASLAAIKRKIPVIVHEQNVFPGLAVKMLAKKADITAISFEKTREMLKAKRIELTGNPIREELFDGNKEDLKELYGFDKEKTVLMFGGSLGAGGINNAIYEMLKKGFIKDFNLIAGIGERFFSDFMKKLEEEKIELPKNVKLMPYISDMKSAMANSDLVVSRAGAITVSEICALQKPAILLPSANVAHNHQEFNARLLLDSGAAKMILENDLTGESLFSEIKSVISDDKILESMKTQAGKLGIRTANKDIYHFMKELTL